MKTTLRRIGSLLSGIAVLASALLLLAAFAGPRLGLYRTEVVLSGSMVPTFSPGDLLVVRPQPARQLQVGEVITYAIPVGDHHVESHRVVRILRHGDHPIVVTRGDANAEADPWRARLDQSTVWRVVRVVPSAGRVLLWLHSPLLRWLDVAVLPLLLLVGWLGHIWRPRDGASEAAAS